MQLKVVSLLVGILFAVTQMKYGVESKTVCPTFWVPFQESCYRIFGNLLNWSDAEESCNKYFNEFEMGHMVSIRSSVENRFVADLWESATNGRTTTPVQGGVPVNYWIGLSNKDNVSRWVWSDTSEEAVYTEWAPSEPNYLQVDHCAHTWPKNGNSLTWNNWRCDKLLFFVCELPQSRH
ncbi:C-type lectin mannose-binding isoform-like [Antedon mediterranea]|uniref:C-type lectin mannose-binding isoform-like n=1 Tax=Antedon mediterranea TaxID=105859 RepID=UPI003AF99621